MKPGQLKWSDWLKLNLFFVAEHIWGAGLLRSWIKRNHSRLHFSMGEDASDGGQSIFRINELDIGEAGPSPNVCIFRGGASDWMACKTWSLDFFQDNYGDRIVEIQASKGLTDPESPSDQVEMTLHEYIEEIRNGTKRYLKLSDLVNKEPSLKRDLDYSWLKKFRMPCSFSEMYYTFMGAKGSVTPLHNEFPCNVYVQVSGMKRWILYPANSRYFLGATTERRPYFFSEYNPDRPDEVNFPLHNMAERLEVVLHPGDVLWVPPFVWHHVENLTDSIGVAYKFVHIPSSIKSSKLLTTLFFLSTRPSIFYSFIAGKLKGKDLILTNQE